jgi:hypothetical protein
MKLLFGLLGAVMVLVFLGSIVVKVPEVSLIAVVLIGVAMMFVDLWQAREEPDT